MTTFAEEARISQINAIVPKGYQTALDVGCQNGSITKLLVPFYEKITALDLKEPSIADKKIKCTQGDATSLIFPDSSFDVVFCFEVLEHIPTHLLNQACKELARVAKHKVVIGVPYKQDIRLGRALCYTCGKRNPPYGHVSSFDERKLAELFKGLELLNYFYVNLNDRKDFGRTNRVSELLNDLAGNPYGVYNHMCIYCGTLLTCPTPLKMYQKLLFKISYHIRKVQNLFFQQKSEWIHAIFEKR